MLYLGIDSGTQSTKCIVLDTDTWEILASSQAAYSLIPDLPPGHLEQHPQDWVDATEQTITACLAKLGARRDEVRGIGVSGQQHGLVVLDADGNVIRPAKLWCDTSTAPQCEEFATHFGGQRCIVKMAGNQISPGYTAPKLLWLKQNERRHFKAIDSILLPHDYLNFWLTGEKTMEYGDASGTGLLDVQTREWCGKLIDFIDPDLIDKLPVPQSSQQPAGLLRDELRQRWGLTGNVVVSSGGGDNMMGAIGTGNIQPGVVTASFGTSGTLYACADKPIIDPDGDVAAFCDSTDHWLPLVCTMNVTVATEQVRQLFGWDHGQLNTAVANAEPGAGGVLFLPYLNGERTPNLPNGTGVLHGLTTKNMTSENIARATMEGVTLGLAYGLSRMARLRVEPTEIRLTGGGSKSAVWRQIAADIFGVPVVCLATAEGAALGAAVQAVWVEGLVNGRGVSLASLCEKAVALDPATRCTPHTQVQPVYAALLKRQTEITRQLHQSGHL
ncbi:MAG TPA: xylulokinase [Chthoniobacterales bacterium]|jgi:xylulokinase